MAIQFRTNQYADGSVTRAKHESGLGHASTVDNFNIVKEHPGSSNPFATPKYHEIVYCTSDGTWNGDAVTEGDYYQYQSVGWESVGTRAVGDKMVVTTGSSAVPSVDWHDAEDPFTGHEGEVATWDGSSWSFEAPDYGWLLVIIGNGTWNQVSIIWLDHPIMGDGWFPVTVFFSKTEGAGLDTTQPSPDSEDGYNMQVEPGHGIELTENGVQVKPVDIGSGGSGLSVSSSGLSVDTGDGLKLDDTTGALEALLSSIGALGFVAEADGNAITVRRKANGGLDVDVDGLHLYPTASGEYISATNLNVDTDYFLGRNNVAVRVAPWLYAVDVLRIYSDVDQGGTDPTPSAHTGEAWVVNNWEGGTNGDIVESDGTNWNVIVPNSGGAPPAGTRAIVDWQGTPEGSFAGQPGKIATRGASSWVFDAPDEGVSLVVKADSYYEYTIWTYDGTANDWANASGVEYTAGDGIDIASGVIAVDLAASNPGLQFDGSGDLAALAAANGGVAVGASGLYVSPTAQNAISASNPVADKDYVDSVVVSGVSWKLPVDVRKMKSDADQSGTPPTAGETGEAWVVNNWGGGYTDGDIVEWDGSAWQVVIDEGGAGEPPDGTRVLVIASGAAGSFATEEDSFATYDADTDSWSFEAPVDGDATLVVESSIYENQAYVYDDTPGGWIQFAGNKIYTAGDGIDITTNEISAVAGDGISVGAGGVAVDFVHYEDTLTSGEAGNNRWELSGQVGTLVETSAVVTRNGQKMKKTATNPPTNDGEWYWDDANDYVIFKSGYLADGDEMSIWSLET